MDMIVRQTSDLVQGRIVSQRQYHDETPEDILGVLRLILHNCTDFLRQEGTPIRQDTISLNKLTLSYPGMAGLIEVIVGSQNEK